MQHGWRRRGATTGVAATAALALVMSGAAPAIAADIQVGPDDLVISLDGDAVQWFTDVNYAVEDTLTFNECSVTFGEYPDDDEFVIIALNYFVVGGPEFEGPDVAGLRGWFDSLAFDILDGELFFEVVVVATGLESGDDVDFFHLATVDGLGAGATSLADADLQDLSGWGSTASGDYNAHLDHLEETFGDPDAGIPEDFGYQVLFVAVSGTPGTEISTISVGDDTYYFGTGDCTPVVDDGDDDSDVDDDTDGDVDADTGAPTPPQSVETDA